MFENKRRSRKKGSIDIGMLKGKRALELFKHLDDEKIQKFLEQEHRKLMIQDYKNLGIEAPKFLNLKAQGPNLLLSNKKSKSKKMGSRSFAKVPRKKSKKTKTTTNLKNLNSYNMK